MDRIKDGQVLFENLNKKVVKQNKIVERNVKDLTEAEKEEIKREVSSYRIIYCSRTHTQIREFISELKKTRYSNLRVIHLGSRANYCIEPSVIKKSENSVSGYDNCHSSMINEKCKLVREGSKKCQFYKKFEIDNTKD